MEKDLESIISAIENECFSLPWSIENIRSVLVSEFDKVITISDYAYINYRIMYDEAELMRIAVRQNMRGQGLADTLMFKMLEDLKKNRIKTCILELRESNTKALSLYKKYNFKVIDRRKSYYTKPTEDALIMLLEI